MTNRFIYFIKPVGMDGPVKIGISARPESRMQQMLEWSPFDLEIVHVIPGDYFLEKAIHQSLCNDHLRREWFEATPRIVRLLEDLRRGVAIEDAVDLARVEGQIRTPSKANRRRRPRGNAVGSSLTQGQVECLALIKAFSAEHGRVPTYQEICDGMGLHSKSGVHRYILGLEERGRITRVPGLRCGYQLVAVTEQFRRAA